MILKMSALKFYLGMYSFLTLQYRRNNVCKFSISLFGRFLSLESNNKSRTWAISISWNLSRLWILHLKVKFWIGDYSGSFLRRQLSIDNYHVKKYVKESQVLLFSRQKVYKNSKFVYITEILWRTFWRDHFLTL